MAPSSFSSPRVTPIVPELLALLDAAYHAAPEGAEFILPTLRLHSNPSTPMLRAMRDSGIEQWPRIFHALRASCVTDLAGSHPLADVAAWMGHTRTVAAKHYLRATEASFASATVKNPGDTGGDNHAKTVVTPVVTQGAAIDRSDAHKRPQTPCCQEVSANGCDSKRDGATPGEMPSNAASGPYWARTSDLLRVMEAR